MKNQIISGGKQIVLAGDGMRARLRELRNSIQARHASEMADAGFIRRLILRWRIAAEYRRERRKILPSSQSLYNNRATSR